METAIIGLLGVVLGAALTIGRELLSEWRTNRKESQYLAIRVVCIFDRFVDGCVAVVGDDGTWHGQTGADGCAKIQVDAPTLNLSLENVNWKSLPPNLMYEILAFPNSLEDANHIISSTFDIAAFPPTYDEGFEERQYQYSKLGLRASKLNQELRNKYNISDREFNAWNPVEIMEKTKSEIETLRNKRAEQVNESIQKSKNA